jgi:hydrogenase maturation protease
MIRNVVDRIVKAVLYEGYILYPYRPSVKNRQRWTFGGLYPEAYCQLQRGSDASRNQTECLVHGSPQTALNVTVRFLHLVERVVGEIVPPLGAWTDGTEPPYRPVETLRVGEQVFHSWQEAKERDVGLTEVTLGELLERPRRQPFAFPGRRWLEPLHRPDGQIGGVLVRQQYVVEGAIESEVTWAAEGLFKVTLRVVNDTPLEPAAAGNRDAALLRSLASTHAILCVRQGEFVSLLDPPEDWREAAAACRNVGSWPVLVGEERQKDAMLSSPMILYDYPQVAPESPGDLFDATEIDEILTLRILTLTDEEKRAAAGVDDRARELLARTESLAREQLAGLHGTVRNLRPVAQDKSQ